MLEKFYTIMVITERGASIKKYQLRTASLKIGVVAAAVFLCLIGLLLADYTRVRGKLSELPVLKEENRAMKAMTWAMEAKLESLEIRLARIVRLDKKLREVAGIDKTLPGSTDIEQGIGGPIPLGIDLAHTALSSDEKAYLRRLSLIMDRLGEGYSYEEASMEQLAEVLAEKRSMLARLPNIWPAAGLLTSKFGMRRHPTLGVVRLHEGIDIAAPRGSEVIAPADGLVIFAGWKGGYGNLLSIDHGSGFITRYGHLSKFNVKTGQKVRKGESVANIGATGQSTGPHLHYEVRLNGLPVNPLKYIIE